VKFEDNAARRRQVLTIALGEDYFNRWRSRIVDLVE
jgi:hypothetical protein